MASQDAVVADASLLKKHSRIVSVVTERYSYPGVRVFYRAHPKAASLPPQLPLVVFIHGLGGQIQQFRHLIEYLVHFSHVLAIDLPGCGASDFDPKDWDAYSTDALCALVAKVVGQYRGDNQKVVVIGHSMGCALGATLVTKGGLLEGICSGFVAISPKAVITEKEQKAAAAAVKLPEFAFNMFRAWDRRGGINSKSVMRFVGKNASEDVRRMQLHFNEQSRTPVWRRMVSGIKLPSREQWRAIKLPILLLGAIEDKVTTVGELDMIHSWFDPKKTTSSVSSQDSSGSDRPVSVVKKCIIPDAGHGVMYESPNVLCGLVGEFLSKHVDETLSLGWQLLYLKEDKWLLKNLEKWTRIQSVSPRIVKRAGAGKPIPSPFRAMKTLRQNDPDGHNPIEFCQRWTDVRDIIDISHETPPYDPETFGGDLNYHKYPTVSKIPPTLDEVTGFIKLVDSIREARKYDENSVIACHCHYGFNRTGFFICTYLIERLGFSVQEAIEAFKEARPPGIRHPHFINELFERYCLGLLRAPTF
ncbi:Alpha/Beta hydrolase protein [Tricharina praecox]|uniref:Alpha/Beta hydrolase protein n=1 Tax=Tricharina praecox TaxID=43433 RepID=UPI0022204C44|nr:Alpha/Beta hydrolase protein [Tricharina praecox]KAI5844888.1 Alpha/Beta hydrolase protein [Tricharina praecox]